MTTATASAGSEVPAGLSGYPAFLVPRTVADGVYFAGFWVRVGASLIDAAAQLVLYLVVQFIFQAIASIISAFVHFQSDQAVGWTSAVAALAVLVYYNLVLVARHAASPGMRAVSMRIVSDADLTAAPARRALYVRGLIWLLFTITVVPGVIDSLAIIVNPRKRSIHDMAAGTAMVRRAPRPRALRALLCTACGEPVDEGTLCPKHGGSMGLTLTLSGHSASLQIAASLLGVFAFGALITGVVLAVTGRLEGLGAIVAAVLLLRLTMSLTQLREWARWAACAAGLIVFVGAAVLGAAQLSSSTTGGGALLVVAALGLLVAACVWTPETYREFHSLT